MSARRTVRRATLVVETRDLSDEEHLRRVQWAEKNILNANTYMNGAFVAVVIDSEDGQTRFTGSGTPTPETAELIEEMQAPDEEKAS